MRISETPGILRKLCVRVCANAVVQAIAYHCISLHSVSGFGQIHNTVFAFQFLPETAFDITPAQNILLIFAACFCSPALMKIHGLRSIDPDRT